MTKRRTADDRPAAANLPGLFGGMYDRMLEDHRVGSQSPSSKFTMGLTSDDHRRTVVSLSAEVGAPGTLGRSQSGTLPSFSIALTAPAGRLRWRVRQHTQRLHLHALLGAAAAFAEAHAGLPSDLLRFESVVNERVVGRLRRMRDGDVMALPCGWAEVGRFGSDWLPVQAGAGRPAAHTCILHFSCLCTTGDRGWRNCRHVRCRGCSTSSAASKRRAMPSLISLRGRSL